MSDFFLSQTQTMRQQQTLAPQQLQSLEMLQSTVLELRSVVQQEMERNPTLEELEPGEKTDAESKTEEPVAEAADAGDPAASEPDEVFDDRLAREKKEAESPEDTSFKDEFEKLAALDDEWREDLRRTRSLQPYSAEEAERRQFFLDSLTGSLSLQQHLMDQLTFSIQDEQERQAGELIIGSINDEGYLTTPLDEMASSSALERSLLERVLTLVQEFDPVGVGARDLRECLLLQLRRMGQGESLAARLVDEHLQALGGRKFPELARALKVGVERIQEAARFIGTLEPKPGRRFEPDSTSYVLPEVFVRKVGDEYVVHVNNDQLPRLHISGQYRQLMADPASTSEVRGYIREKVRAGLFLIRSINQRQETILNIAREIVRVQRDFFEQGITHLRPLTMSEVAQVVGIHETTVSRAVSNKYMQTPRGVFEMKYFFTPGYRNADGESISNKAVKDAIATLIAGEDARHPLSDQEMADRLSAQGTKVARRTVAKYREELKILPSHLRRQYG